MNERRATLGGRYVDDVSASGSQSTANGPSGQPYRSGANMTASFGIAASSNGGSRTPNNMDLKKRGTFMNPTKASRAKLRYSEDAS